MSPPAETGRGESDNGARTLLRREKRHPVRCSHLATSSAHAAKGVSKLSRIASDYFADVDFPARREELVVAAISRGAPLDLVQALRELPKEWYMEPSELPDLPFPQA